MNTDNTVPITPDPSNQPIHLSLVPDEVSQSKIEMAGPARSQNSKITQPFLHRKIAKLPKPLRDLINCCLDDSLPAKEIIDKLQASTNPPLPYPISEVNISDWRKTGYQRHVQQQERLALIESNRESAMEMVAANDTTTLPEATLQIITSQYFDFLGAFSTESLLQKLTEDPLKYSRFLNVFARLTREIVHLRKYRDKAAAEAEQAAAQKKAHLNWFQEADAYLLNSPNKRHSAAIPESESPTTEQQFPEPPASPAPPPLTPPAPEFTESVTPPVSEPQSPAESPRADTAAIISERCLDCRHPLPPLTAEGKRPDERCQNCGVLLPAPGLCTRSSKDPCHHCGKNLPARLPTGRRPRPTCHNCGAHLGRELDEDIQKYAQQ